MKRRQTSPQRSSMSSGSGGDGLPHYQNNNSCRCCQNMHDINNQRKLLVLGFNKGRKIALFILSTLVLISLQSIFVSLFTPQQQTTENTAATRYGPPTNTTNPFISKFENVLLSNNLDNDIFVPLILNNNQILCRKQHLKQLSHYRTRFFTQMVRTQLHRYLKKKKQQASDDLHHIQNNNFDDVEEDGIGLPILQIDADDCGCNVHYHRDDYGYPRLAWSTFSPKHGACSAISIPSYETWKYYHRTHKLSSDWERTFVQNDKYYPWSTKNNKAVWRGSTTYEGSQYSQSELKDTPRGRLVLTSMEHPEFVDAGFHKINQKFKIQKKELKDQFTVSKRMNLKDMMKYKAIIDIDGNNWSSRFGMLLCSNSVVIKIEPDFIEYFYSDIGGNVKPNEHYLPASLDNITNVVRYVMDAKNENEMKSIVKSANNWCAQSLSEEGLANDTILQLGVYKKALDDMYQNNWKNDWKKVKQRFTNTIDDLVDCNAWSIIDYFTYPIFAGL